MLVEYVNVSRYRMFKYDASYKREFIAVDGPKIFVFLDFLKLCLIIK